MATKLRTRVAGNMIFFPIATAYAIFILPASVFSMLGFTDIFPALSSAGGHAHEMLFGFALAVVAGNQIGPITIPRLVLLAGTWVIARAAFLTAPLSITATIANIIFAGLLVLHIAPRLFKAAKKLRNQALPMVLTAICVSSIAFHLDQHTEFLSDKHTIPTVTVLLLTLLMLFMGGRIIAPKVAGQFYRQGDNLSARVQPRIEGGILIAMTVAFTASMIPNEKTFTMLVAAATITAGILSVIRFLRWRLWKLQGRPDLLCLAAGYSWLPVGLLVYGVLFAAGHSPTAALHIITIGALGTLTLNVMHMTWALKAKLDPTYTNAPVWATLLIATAVLARVLASFGIYDSIVLLQLAAILWSSAFLLLFIQLMRIRIYQN